MRKNVLPLLLIAIFVVVLIGFSELQKTGFVTAFIGGFPVNETTQRASIKPSPIGSMLENVSTETRTDISATLAIIITMLFAMLYFKGAKKK